MTVQQLRGNALVALLFAGLTILVTYPQIQSVGTSVPFHTDPYFSMWRLGWVAHAIVHAPRSIFEANIFYPEHHALAYSDAMLLPGIVLAPLFWIGMNPIAIYNLALFAAFTISGFTMFALARHLNAGTAAAIAAGIVYAFAPYRFTHYAHLELQMVFWSPLALLMVHRTIASGRMRDGVLAGVLVGCQILCSIYAGIFLALYCVVVGSCLMIMTRVPERRRLLTSLIAGGLVAVLLASPYLPAYSGARKTVGTRSLDDVRLYSASLSDFLSAPGMNRLYGWTAGTDRLRADEMNLFPGVAAVILAMAGIIAGRGRARFAYTAGLVFAIAMTSGTRGYVYPWLFEHIAPFRALRSAARFDMFVNLSLAALSAYGVDVVLERTRILRQRRVTAAAVVAILIAEYASAPLVSPAPKPSRVDAQLARMPPVVIVELPIATGRGIGLSLDFLYMYQGLSHFQRMLNGYSGFVPASFYQMREKMAAFPDDASIGFLRDRHVDYVVVRAGLYDGDQGSAVLEQISRRSDLTLEAMWPTGPAGAEAIYAVK